MPYYTALVGLVNTIWEQSCGACRGAKGTEKAPRIRQGFLV